MYVCMYTATGTMYCKSTSAFLSKLCFIDIRLVPMDYNQSYSGRLEVFFNNEWGQVCDTAFNSSDVTVVCSQIGYATLQSEIFSTSLPANSRIWIQNVNCLSTESTLLDCPSDVEFHIGKVNEPCNSAIGVTCLLCK